MDNIFGNNLKSARLMAGLSLRQLANQLDISLSPQALSYYENGKRKPDSSIIISLSEVLKVPIDYFFRDSKVVLKNIEFRKKSILGKKGIEQIKEFVINYIERYIEIEEILNIQIQFNNPLKNIVINNNQDIENAAIELRKYWDLGSNPISNITEMLEDKGIKIVEVDFDNNFDGLSTWVDNLPVIVINKNLDLVRKRFTVLHELAHLLLNFSNLEIQIIEKLCHSFAGAFLLPKSSLKSIIGTARKHYSIDELSEIKEYFGISVQAIIYRLYNIKLISDITLKKFFIKLNVENHRNEIDLGTYIGNESSSRFERLVYKSASEEIITFSKAAMLLSMDIDKFRSGFNVL